MIEGADLSSDIQTNVDWDKFRAAGKRFVYLQASRYSGTVVLGYPGYRARANLAGVDVGAYHFAFVGSDPVKQAEFAFKRSGEIGGLGTLRPCIDLEYAKGYTADQTVAWLIAYAKRMTELTARRQIACYTYPWFWHNLGPSAYAASEVAELTTLAIAAYRSDANGRLIPWTPADDSKPPVPSPWTNWWMWQYSGNNTQIPGVSGDCDHDRLNLSENEYLIETGKAPALKASEKVPSFVTSEDPAS